MKQSRLFVVAVAVVLFLNGRFLNGSRVFATGEGEAATEAETYLTIDETNFPDPAFREYIRNNHDIDGNGLLDEEEIGNVEGIDCSKGVYGFEGGIKSLEGIGCFTNLQRLVCNDNEIGDLDLSKNTSLLVLACMGNKIEKLNVHGLKELVSLYCEGNQLTELDLCDNNKLEMLNCNGNQLTSLELSNCAGMKYLYCQENKLTALNISNNMELYLLECDDNQISDLELSKCQDLEFLFCIKNKLGDLDVSNCPKLKMLYCGENALSRLDVSNNRELTILQISNNDIAELDISNNTKLRNLYVSVTKVEELDISNCPELVATFQTGSEDGYHYARDLDNGDRSDLYVTPNTRIIVNIDMPVEDRFDDVVAGKWYVPFIQYAYDHGYMKGKSDTVFGTEDGITRAEVVQVLYNKENKPEVTFENIFSDVNDASAWFAHAVCWANKNDIVSGYPNGKFGVNDMASREQMAMILYKYAKLKEFDVSADLATLDGYNDRECISGWAKEAMAWAVTHGIMKGKGEIMDPLGIATRAEFATVIKNFCTAYEGE